MFIAHDKPRGSTTVIVAVSLTAFLALMTFVIDAAGAYVLTARLQNATDSAADAGIAKVADLIIEYANRRAPEAPPGADPRDYLTEEDRQAILFRSEPKESTEGYLSRNGAYDATYVQYPARAVSCGDPALRDAELRVTAEKNYTFLLGKLLNGNDGSRLKSESIQTLRLCPSS